MKRIRTIIVDDEPLARRGIRVQLESVHDFKIVAECCNGSEAVESIGVHCPDLVFLDIQMPELDAFGVIDTVGVERMPAVIFVTAFDRYAVRAFEVHAVDYVLKPLDEERFVRAIERARWQIEHKKLHDLPRRLQDLLDELKPSLRLAISPDVQNCE